MMMTMPATNSIDAALGFLLPRRRRKEVKIRPVSTHYPRCQKDGRRCPQVSRWSMQEQHSLSGRCAPARQPGYINGCRSFSSSTSVLLSPPDEEVLRHYDVSTDVASPATPTPPDHRRGLHVIRRRLDAIRPPPPKYIVSSPTDFDASTNTTRALAVLTPTTKE